MILLEVIATSPEDCIAIAQSGGDRIELTTALDVGGLTPSLGLVIEARKVTRLPLMVMIRPRSGGFCYSAGEFAALQRDLDLALEHGANGVVVGILEADGTVDVRRTRQLVQQASGKQTTFHRAFDMTPDPLRALDTLIELGVTRVLTSGQEASALEGSDKIVAFLEHAEGQLQILPAGGITANNVAEIIDRTGVNQVHASLSTFAVDPSTLGNPHLNLAGATPGLQRGHRVVDPAAVAAVRLQLNALAID